MRKRGYRIGLTDTLRLPISSEANSSPSNTSVVAINLRDIKAVYFVREFSDSEDLRHSPSHQGIVGPLKLRTTKCSKA